MKASRVVRVVAVVVGGGVEAKGLGNEDPVTLSSHAFYNSNHNQAYKPVKTSTGLGSK